MPDSQWQPDLQLISSLFELTSTQHPISAGWHLFYKNNTTSVLHSATAVDNVTMSSTMFNYSHTSPSGIKQWEIPTVNSSRRDLVRRRGEWLCIGLKLKSQMELVRQRPGSVCKKLNGGSESNSLNFCQLKKKTVQSPN